MKWLHCIGKPDTPLFQCGEEESGHHIVISCPRFNVIRNDFLGPQKTEELDAPDWRRGEGGDAWYIEAVEEFFRHLYGGAMAHL